MSNQLKQSCKWLLILCIFSGFVFSISPQYSFASDTSTIVLAAPNPQPAILTCISSSPIVRPGGTVEIFVWVASATGEPLASKIVPRWSTASGSIYEKGGRFFWHLEGATLGEHTATVSIEIPFGSSSEGILKLIVSDDTGLTTPSDERGQKERIAGRSFLLPDKKEDSGYGLYSYVLFAAPPNIKQKERYLKVLEVFFEKILPISELNLHFLRSELNVFYIPIKKYPPETLNPNKLASFVLENFDYARAKHFLANLPAAQKVNLMDGLYFVSSKLPLSVPAIGPSLVQELHPNVPEHLVWEWTRYFMLVTSQQHSWGEIALVELRLKMRIVVANLAVGLPEVQKSLNSWIRLTQGN